MTGLSRWNIVALLLTGCASVPPPAPEPDVPAGAPWGLAWIPPSGEVAVRAGAIEHVLYPQARAEKPVRAPLGRNADSDSAQRALLSHLLSRTATTRRARTDRACDIEHDAVPAWFLSQAVEDRVLTVKSGDACAVSPKK